VAQTRVKHARYIDEFVRLTCAPDLLKHNLFPNGKELTESMGMFAFVRKYLWDVLRPDDSRVNVMVVGDGHRARTGAMFAMRTRWHVVSIDPAMTPVYGINRLSCVPVKVETLDPVDLGPFSLLVTVHSHAPLDKMLATLDTAYWVDMPCCQDTMGGWSRQVEDPSIWSPKNKLYLYVRR
jgi:hypothetical protein